MSNNLKTENADYTCERCNGRGTVTFGYTNVRTGTCFKCNGSGVMKTSRQQRAQQRQSRVERQAKEQAYNWESFKTFNPEIAAFLEASQWSAFYQSIKQQICKGADLSPLQMTSIELGMEKAAKRAQEANQPAVVVDLSGVFEKFEAAQASGLKKPKLRLDGFCLSLAGGRNVGSLYVKEGPAYEDTYLGKISPDGVFTKSRDCSAEQVEALKTISANVLDAAVAYGRKTGNCSCCGRELTNAKSIELGIGPVCLDKWGL